VAEVALRSVEDSDLDALFDQMRDPESVRMAAFTAKDPDDRAAFDTHMSKLRASPDITLRAVTLDGHLVGSISSFVMDGDTEITFWIDRSVWGRGVAGRALTLFLDTVAVRPLHARAAGDNPGSLSVLRKAGFTITGTEVSYAPARNAEIEETILRLDQAPAQVNDTAYVRFQGTVRHERGFFPGVFMLVNRLARDGVLTAAQERFRREGNDWFDAAYVTPSDVDPAVYDPVLNPGAVAWFKSSARHLIERIDGYLEILAAHGVACERIESTDPGRVIYEDEHQVVVVPHG
jgi:RimJ/RimL family protein N-acetyltransferase